VPLRPLNLGDILGGSFRAVRFNAPVLVGMTVAILLVAQLVPAACLALWGDGLSRFTLQRLSDSVGSLTSLIGVSGLATALATLFAEVFVTYGVFEAVLARRPTVAETWRAVARRVGPVAGYTGLTVLAVLACVALAVAVLVGVTDIGARVGGVVVLVLSALAASLFLTVRLAFVVPAIVVDRTGVFAGIARSWRLTRGRFWRTLGLILITGFVTSLAAQAVSFVVTLVSMPLMIWADATAVTLIASLAGSVLGSAVSVPLITAAVALIYVDARIRQEGLDIALSEELWS
jgi:hypothetical protein